MHPVQCGPTGRRIGRRGNLGTGRVSDVSDITGTARWSGPSADMAGKRIALTRATLEEATVPKVAPKGTEIVYFDDIGPTIQALMSGQVDAAGMSAFAAKSISDRNPAAGIETKFTVTTAYYAPVVRQADASLRQWINTWVFVNSRNGVLAGIYEKYTGVKLPPLPTI